MSKLVEIIILVSMLSVILLGLKYAYGSSPYLEDLKQKLEQSHLNKSDSTPYENQTLAEEVTLRTIVENANITIPDYLHPTITQLWQIVDEINRGGYPYKILMDIRNELQAKQELSKPLN